MKLNPYSLLLIVIFIATVSISNNTIKNNKKKYEKINNDSSVCVDHCSRTIGKM